MTTAIELFDARKFWAAKQANEPLWPGGPTPREYVRGFGRPTGSFVTGGVFDEEIPDEQKFYEFCHDVDHANPNGLTELVETDVPAGTYKPGHRYFTVQVPPGYQAFQCVAQVKDLSTDQLESVRLRRSKHGVELVSSHIPPIPTDQLVFISDSDGLVTWYPGVLTPAVNPAVLHDLSEATVKLLRE